MKNIQWGIIGAGWIAQKFCEALKFIDDGSVRAIYTKTISKADELANQYQIPFVYHTIDTLLADKQIDIIYIATPHPSHAEMAKACLNAGKPVLCEKPFTMNLKEACEVIDLAKQNNLFLMEAMWSRFLPQVRKTKDLLDSGKIGKATMLQADLGHLAPKDNGNRFYNKALGGGALLDTGVYPVSFAVYMFGVPERIKTFCNFAETGADQTISIDFHYSDGRMAKLFASFEFISAKEANIFGEHGRLHILAPWMTPSPLEFIPNTGEKEKFDFDFIGNGYNYEIKECHKCLQSGKLESDIMPHQLTLDIMSVLDRIREAAKIF